VEVATMKLKPFQMLQLTAQTSNQMIVASQSGEEQIDTGNGSDGRGVDRSSVGKKLNL
jgi:hypothetical protein